MEADKPSIASIFSKTVRHCLLPVALVSPFYNAGIGMIDPEHLNYLHMYAIKGSVQALWLSGHYFMGATLWHHGARPLSKAYAQGREALEAAIHARRQPGERAVTGLHKGPWAV